MATTYCSLTHLFQDQPLNNTVPSVQTKNNHCLCLSKIVIIRVLTFCIQYRRKCKLPETVRLFHGKLEMLLLISIYMLRRKCKAMTGHLLNYWSHYWQFLILIRERSFTVWSCDPEQHTLSEPHPNHNQAPQIIKCLHPSCKLRGLNHIVCFVQYTI